MPRSSGECGAHGSARRCVLRPWPTPFQTVRYAVQRLAKTLNKSNGSLAEWAPGPLDAAVIDQARLPGGATDDEIAELLRLVSADAGSRLQASLSEEEWALYSQAADAYWRDVTVPILLRTAELADRPDVIARVVALSTSGLTPCIVSGYVGVTSTGRLVIRQLTIEPELELPSGISSQTLRSISPSQILAGAEHVLTSRPEWLSVLERVGLGVPEGHQKQTAESAARAAARSQRAQRGRPSLPHEHYIWVARTYLALYGAGHRRGIRVRLAELASARYGRSVPQGTVRDWVHRARELGLLTPGTRGKAGARPGASLPMG